MIETDLDEQIAVRLFGDEAYGSEPCGPVSYFWNSSVPMEQQDVCVCEWCGKVVEPAKDENGRNHPYHEVPPTAWSTDIRAAWVVVEKMRERGWDVSVERDQESLWCCVFYRGGDMAMKDWNPHVATNESAPMAICEAALKALV
jgi:hypothetical protein